MENAKIILLGFSEGTEIATIVANNKNVEIFENHDHNLNYMFYPINGTISEGLQSIFESSMTI